MSAASMSTNAGARDVLTHLRLLLRTNGYSPVPADGKAVYLPDWQTAAQRADETEYRRWRTTFGYEVDSKARTYRGDRHTNTGLLCGELVGVDIDVPVHELATQVEGLAAAMLGETPLRRIGRAPKVLRAYRAEVTLPKIATPELFLPDGTKVQIEILGKGQQFVAYGIHPETSQEYKWPESGPDV